MKRALNLRQAKSREAFSLIEVVILALGIASSIMTARYLAESNIYQNTSFTVAQGYMEQIKSMEYGILTNALAAYNNNQEYVDKLPVLNDNSWEDDSIIGDIMLDTKSINALTTGIGDDLDLEAVAPLYVGAWVEREVLIDIRDPDSDNAKEVTMKMKLRPLMRNLRDAGPDVDALEISIQYEYETRERGGRSWRENAVYFVKSYAPTF